MENISYKRKLFFNNISSVLSFYKKKITFTPTPTTLALIITTPLTLHTLTTVFIRLYGVFLPFAVLLSLVVAFTFVQSPFIQSPHQLFPILFLLEKWLFQAQHFITPSCLTNNFPVVP